MSQRKHYQLLLDGAIVVDGPYGTVRTAYNSAYSVLKLLGILKEHSLVIAFSFLELDSES